MRPEIMLKPEFVEFVPDELEERTLYIAAKYRTVAHLCCCGCGRKVFAPLSPVGWKLTFDGVSISLHPSIGNWTFPCKSHYWIDSNRVIWAAQWSQGEIDAGRAAEARARAAFYGEEPVKAEPRPAPPAPIPTMANRANALSNEGFWRRWWKRLFGS